MSIGGVGATATVGSGRKAKHARRLQSHEEGVLYTMQVTVRRYIYLLCIMMYAYHVLESWIA